MSMLDCTLEELERLNGDEMMDKIVKETKYLNEDSDFVKFMSVEEEDRLYINTWKAEGKEEGLKEGIKEGVKKGISKGKKEGIAQAKKEMAKSLLKENSPIDFISRVTGLTIKEINKIKNAD